MAEALYPRFFAWMKNKGIKASRLDWQSPGGGRVQGWIFSPPGPDRLMVVSLHGTGNDAFFPQCGLFARLLTAGHQVFAFDLDGHGQTSTSLLDRQEIRSALPRALEQVRSAGQVHVLGHSLGGVLALDALARHSEKLRSLVLIGTPLKISLSPGQFHREALSPLFGSFWRQRRWYGVAGIFPAWGPFRRDRWPVRLSGQPGSFDYISRVREIVADIDPQNAGNPQNLPVLSLHGRYDSIAPPDHGRIMSQHLPGCTTDLVPGNHFTASLSKETADRVTTWLQKTEDS